MLPIKEQSQHIFRRLQSDDLFENLGKDSRHIALPTDVIIGEFTELAQATIDPNARQFLGVAVGIFESIGKNGISVRIKDRYNIAIRGVMQELSEQPALPELIAAVTSRSGIDIDLFGHEPTIGVRVVNPDEDALAQVKRIISEIPIHAKFAVVKGILDIINHQLDQVLDA